MLYRRSLAILALTLLTVSLWLLLPSSHLYLLDVDIPTSRGPETLPSHTRPQTIEATATLPPEYYPTPGPDDTCSRFSPTYFRQFQDHVASYCEANSGSTLLCFHRYSGFDGKTDSFCYARGAVLNVENGKFQLDCSLRQFSEQEERNGLLPFNRLPGYWYETGPSSIFAQAIDVERLSPQPDGGEQETEKRQDLNHDLEPNTTSSVTPPKKFLLLKREGEGNPWHSLLEIFSTYMTIDILRMSGDASGDNVPRFRVPDDSDDTQVVILDDREDGPYFELWTLFARRKPLRLKELLVDRSTHGNPQNIDLIIPLAGSSNPLWKDDSQAQQCNDAPILDVFSSRVLQFYGVQDPSVRTADEPIVVTFIRRQDTRRLQNQGFLFAELQKRNSHIKVQMVDFAAMPFSEQVRVARQTDVLVGVHGAGLTQSLFMRQGAGAVVEIQPEGLDHNGFRNVAGMRGLGYYRAHASTISPEEWVEGEEKEEELMIVREGTKKQETQSRSKDSESIPEATRSRRREREARSRNEAESGKLVQAAHSRVRGRDGWHWSDIDIEESRFFEAVEAAIKFMYNKGPWKYDIS